MADPMRETTPLDDLLDRIEAAGHAAVRRIIAEALRGKRT